MSNSESLWVSSDSIRFLGSDVLGRGTGRMPTHATSKLPSFRTSSYAGSDTILITWNGNLRYRGLLDSLLALPKVTIKIDTTPKTGDIPWQSKVANKTLVDARDGQTYQTVKIGTQTWMAENLNYKTDSSWWYDGSATKGALYGRLYSWSAAMALPPSSDTTLLQINSRTQGICPSGWHLPTLEEWDILATFVQVDTAAKALRCSNCNWAVDTSLLAAGFQDYAYQGNDAFGFRMLGAGFYFPSMKKSRYLNALTSFWTTTESDSISAFSANFSMDDWMYHSGSTNSKSIGVSVRCIQD